MSKIIIFIIWTITGVIADSSNITSITHQVSIGPQQAKFEIHFSEEQRPLVVRVTDILDSTTPIFKYFNYIPQDTIHIIFNGDKTKVNASATVSPTNVIEIFSFPPIGNSGLAYAPYNLRSLVIHELTHIIHLEHTRGINKVLRTIFGTAGTVMPGMVPHWFSEGIATWAEGTFAGGGRQNSPQILYQIARTATEQDFCNNLSCLDEPGIYPHGRNAYWMGADFLAWIEKSRPGSIRCLVWQNAKQLAFLLERTFKKCLGKDASTLFAEYLQYKRKEILPSSARTTYKLRRIRLNGAINLQTGAQVIKDQMIYQWQRNRIKRITILNIASGKSKIVETNNFNVAHILPPSPFSRTQGEVLMAVEKRYKDDLKREIYAFNMAHNTWNIRLPKAAAAEYAFQLDAEKIIFLRWHNLRWEIWLRHRKDKLLHQLPKLLPVQSPRVFVQGGRSWLSMRTHVYGHKRPNQLWIYPLKKNQSEVMAEKGKVLFSSKNNFRYLGQCAGEHLLFGAPNEANSNAGNAYSVGLSGIHTIPRKSLPKELKETAFWRWDKYSTVTFLPQDPENLYLGKPGCGQIMSKLKKHSTSTTTATATRSIPPEKTITPRALDGKSIASYPKLRHLRPRWWGIGHQRDHDIDNIFFKTSMEDPKEHHHLNIQMNWYQQFDKTSTEWGYRYQAMKYKLGLSRYKILSPSLNPRNWDQDSGVSLALYRNFLYEPFSYTPRLSYSLTKSRDIISTRRTKMWDLTQHISVAPIGRQSFLQKMHLNIRLMGGKTSKHGHWKKSFLGMEWHLDSTIAPTMVDVLLHSQIRYSRFFQKDLARGIFFGGGVPLLGGSGRYHDFYGLPARSAFGNDMFSARLQFDTQLKSVYSGLGLFPIYLRQINLLSGIEYIKTDFIYMQKQKRYLRPRDGLHSYHLGSRFKLTMFYKLPLDWDILHIWVQNPYKRENRFVTTLSASIFG